MKFGFASTWDSGATFLNWSVSWLCGARRIRSRSQGWQPILQNPLDTNHGNAHRHPRWVVHGATGVEDILREPTSSDPAVFSLYAHGATELRDSLDRLAHEGVPVIWCPRPLLRYSFTRNGTQHPDPDRVLPDQYRQERGHRARPDQLRQWIRHQILPGLPPRDPSMEPVPERLVITGESVFMATEATVTACMTWLDLPIVPERMTQWRPVMLEWLRMTQPAWRFNQSIDELVHRIEQRLATPIHLNCLQEAVIEQALQERGIRVTHRDRFPHDLQALEWQSLQQ